MQKESISPTVLRDYLLASEVAGPAPQIFSKVYPAPAATTPQNQKIPSMLNSNLFFVDFKRYKPKDLKTVFGLAIWLIFLVIVLCAFIGYQFLVLDYTPPTRYRTNWNTGHDFVSEEETDGQGKWHDCPQHAICRNGVIVDCGQDHELVNDECIRQNSSGNRNFLLEKRMRIKLSEILADRKGQQACGYAGAEVSPVELGQLDELLRGQFGDELQYLSALHQLNDLFTFRLENFPEPIKIINKKEPWAASQIFLESKITKRGLWCSILTILETQAIIIAILSAMIALAAYRLITRLEKNKAQALAENLYKCLLVLLKTEKEVKLDTLIVFLAEGTTKRLRRAVLEELEIIIAIDQQLIVQTDANDQVFFLRA